MTAVGEKSFRNRNVTIFEIPSNTPSSRARFRCSNLGFSVASADVNGNGRDDVIIGSGAKTDGGEVYIVFH